MIDNKNLNLLFEELNKALEFQGEKRNFVIYGGAALISLNITNRATVDIDVFRPKLDPILREIIKEVGSRLMLGEYWVNSTGNAFVSELPKGWQKRTTQIYNGNNLEVRTLGRVDLIFTKVLAELDRQEDWIDLVSLRPLPSELKEIKQHLLDLEDNQEWKNKVLEILKKLNGISDGK